MKKKKYNLSIIIFIVLEVILSFFVHLTSGTLNTITSFFTVVLAFLFALINYNKINKLIVFGLLMTVCADIFLVVLDPMKQNLAMFFFSITQICYFIYIYNNQNNKERKLNVIIRISTIVFALLITLLVLKENTDFLSMISLFYYANLLVNVAFSFLVKNKNIYFIIGLILFACCDLVIGISIMNDAYLSLREGTLLYFIANPGFNLAWIFYIPSQTLIALSTKKDYNLNKNVQL